MIFIGVGFQFCLTPSMIKTSFFLALNVNVKGKGPANLLASFQSVNGESSGREIWSSALSNTILILF